MLIITIVPPVITTQLENTTTVITEGDNTTIECEAIGYPPPTIMWSRTNGTLSDRVSVSDSTSVRIGNGNVTSVSVNLTLQNANTEDTGLYQCSATNNVGTDVKNSNVTVQCKLVVIILIQEMINNIYMTQCGVYEIYKCKDPNL